MQPVGLIVERIEYRLIIDIKEPLNQLSYTASGHSVLANEWALSAIKRQTEVSNGRQVILEKLSFRDRQ